jgi:hypothetical protein
VSISSHAFHELLTAGVTDIAHTFASIMFDNRVWLSSVAARRTGKRPLDLESQQQSGRAARMPAAPVAR